jgi:small-conductance mechanosensitive channel
MNGTMNGSDDLDQFCTHLAALLARGLEDCFGAGVNAGVGGPFTWADLDAAIFVVLLALAASVLLAAFLRRKSRPGAATNGRELHHHVLGAAGQPLAVLIWIYGVYLAAMPLLLKLPADETRQLIRTLFDKLFDLGSFAVWLWLFFRCTHILEARLAALTAKTDSKLDDLFVPLVGKSLRVIAPVLGIIFALPLLGLPPAYAGILGRATSILLIVAVAVILFQAVTLAEKAVLIQYDIKATDNLQARKVYTQIHVISKLLYAIIVLFTICSVLMLFAEVRSYGKSILASAGVIGIVIGFAAQKTIANLFAGFQLAMTQPIRLDDVVIVEGEWGRIEEITLTYVIIHIWDARRLVVPLSYFIDRPFQNWTRVSAELLGSVFLWMDYSLPLDETRQALKEIIETNPLWDQRFWNLQVNEANERAMQIRILATAADSSKSWDLRCEVREKLIAYIQKNHPQSLPQVRASFERTPPAAP